MPRFLSRRVTTDVTAYIVLEQSNVTFRQRLEKVLAECAATEQSRVTEELAKRQDAFTFKKTLRELDAPYLSRVYGEMTLESKVRGERWERGLGRRRVLLGVAYAYCFAIFGFNARLLVDEVPVSCTNTGHPIPVTSS